MQSINNTQVLLPRMYCSHHEVVRQAVKYPQKLAVELDEQSLSYSELLYYVQLLTFHLIIDCGVVPGQIICQCVERSLSMVIGILSIAVAGGAYCPLSSLDPPQRLHTLISQTQSHLVLVHFTTHALFGVDIAILDIDSAININASLVDVNLEQLSTVSVTPENIVFVIFTSGSTGIPKAVQVRHRNFTNFMHSFIHAGILSDIDTIIQMARCSFDNHLLSLIGTLVAGATLVMLRPEGNLDLEYLAGVLDQKQITVMHIIPSLLNSLIHFLMENNQVSAMKWLRSLCSGGETLNVKLASLLKSQLGEQCLLRNHYGPAEITVNCACHLIDVNKDQMSIPIGQALPNYQCLILDEFLQTVHVGQEGELIVGGVGVFAGYFGRNDLTEKVLIDIGGEVFYRTGDLVRMDDAGLIHYVSRKDHQVKLRGQRIELGEIERCLLGASISACVVIKWDNDHLIAYVQSSNVNQEVLREHCQSHLPPHMIPSMFIVLEKLPLNANGKIDRKQLRSPNFSIPLHSDHTGSVASTKLEEHLQRIFSDAFHNESPNINMSFGQMGGTSLDAIRALWLIRQQISTKVNAGLLFANPSIRQLARVIEPLLIRHDDAIVTTTTVQLEDKHDRPMPCLYIELIGILLLICHWIFPIWLAYRSNSFITFLLIPAFHLLSYIICQRLLFCPGEIVNKADQLYSWHYYRWWILNRIWSINNSYWLKHLVGTSFYNSYLRLCGAKIGSHSHIYTTLIDAPWLIEVGESTFIGDDVVFSNLSYHDRTYELHRICIGSYSTINIRSVLYENVTIEDRTYIEPMSSVTDHISTMYSDISIANRALTLWQQIYQLACLLSLLLVHSLLFLFIYKVYSCCESVSLPLSVSLALSWLIWILTGTCVALLLLKYIVGRVRPGDYPSNSYYYLHKIWLRQLIITSFCHSLDFVTVCHVFVPTILRWLGAQIGNDVRLAQFRQILCFPSDLLVMESGSTTFGLVKLAAFEMTKKSVCHLKEIVMGTHTNLGNGCTIMPGTRLSSKTIVGVNSLVTQNTVSGDIQRVLLGIPARAMPFAMTDKISPLNNSSSSSFSLIDNVSFTCFSFFVSKCLLTTLYSKLPVIISPFIHFFLICIFYHYSILSRRKRTRMTFSEVHTRLHYFLRPWISDFFLFFSPYLTGTQFFVFLYRAFGAKIGSDVILTDVYCLPDPYLVTIGDHVRIHMGAYVQCHTFEQRVFKLAPVTVNHSTILMANAVVLPGSILHGYNRILPWTLIMKNEQLPPHTNWYGVPGEQIR